MILYNKILVALDGSEQSEHALEHALEITNKWESSLVILSVVPKIVAPAYMKKRHCVEEYEASLREVHEKVLIESTEKIKQENPSIEVSSRLEKGRPSDLILEVSNDLDVDLIVLGSHGMGGLLDYLGSTSRIVIEASKKPVLLIK